MNRVVNVGRGVIGHLRCHAFGQLLLNLLKLDTYALDHVERVGVWQHPNAHENSLLSGESHFGVVVFRAEHDVSNVAQPNERVLVLANNQLLELVRRVQVRVGG